VIKFTSCLPFVGGSLWVLRLLPPLKWSPWYSWNIAESGVKHKIMIYIHTPPPPPPAIPLGLLLDSRWNRTHTSLHHSWDKHANHYTNKVLYKGVFNKVYIAFNETGESSTMVPPPVSLAYFLKLQWIKNS
jgi:hypothetical protein